MLHDHVFLCFLVSSMLFYHFRFLIFGCVHQLSPFSKVIFLYYLWISTQKFSCRWSWSILGLGCLLFLPPMHYFSCHRSLRLRCRHNFSHCFRSLPCRTMGLLLELSWRDSIILKSPPMHHSSASATCRRMPVLCCYLEHKHSWNCKL